MAEKTLGKLMLGINFILGLVGVCGVFLGICANRHAKDAANAEIADTRAWMAVVDWKVPDPQHVNEGIGKEIQNVGKTPALDLEIKEESVFWKIGTPIPIFTKCPDTERWIAGNTSQAGDAPRVIHATPLATKYTNAQIAEFQRTAGLILHGCLRYKNVVVADDVALPGLTEFCSIFYATPNKDQAIGCGETGNQMK